MKRQTLLFLSFCMAFSFSVSGCNLISNKEKNENTEFVNQTEISEKEDNTENLLEEVTEDVTEAATEMLDSTEVEESTQVTETEEQKSDNSESKLESSEKKPVMPQPPSVPQNPANPEEPSSPQAPPVEEVPNVYLVKVETRQETLNTEAHKYGVTKTGVAERTYEVYSDGSEVCVAEYTSYTYDSSGYNATDDQIRAESDSNSVNYMGYYQEVVNLVNQIRAEAGIGPLTLDTTLCNAASMRALEMDYANYFEHARADGRDCFSVMSYYGCSYSAAGENIAAGYGSPAAVVEGWKNSPGHYANMISADFTKLGVGYCNTGVGESGHYWVQLFSN